MQKEDIQVLYFEDDGRIPNNPNLPLVIYKAVFNEETVQKAESVLFAGTIGRTAGRAEYFRITIFTAPRTKFLSR